MGIVCGATDQVNYVHAKTSEKIQKIKIWNEISKNIGTIMSQQANSIKYQEQQSKHADTEHEIW